MKFEEAMKALNEGKKVRRKHWDEDVYLYKNGVGNVFLGNFDTNTKSRYIPSNINLINDDWEIAEEPKPILDTEEKAYLEAVLRPFKDRVISIHKGSLGDSEYLVFCIKSCIYSNSKDNCTFPFFKPKSMYKNMKILKEYTLKELGLFERKIY